MKRIALLAVVGLIVAIVLAGCKTKMSGELFLRDLDDLVDGELTTKIVFHLPLPGMDECEEYRTRYDRVFAKSNDFKEMEFVKCADEGMDQFVEYELDIPLRLIDPEEEAISGAVEIFRHDDEDSSGRLIFIRANPPSLHDLDGHLNDEFHQDLDLSDTSPLIRLSNDLRSVQVFTVQHVFAQNRPVITPTSYMMGPRDNLEVKLSDVTSAWIFHKSATADPRVAAIGIWTTPEQED